jgi:hypothetical protein
MGIAAIIVSLGKSPGQTDALIKRADGQHSGIAGELARRQFDHQRRAEKG